MLFIVNKFELILRVISFSSSLEVPFQIQASLARKPQDSHCDGNGDDRNDGEDHIRGGVTHGFLALFGVATSITAIIAFDRAPLDRTQVASGLIANAI